MQAMVFPAEASISKSVNATNSTPVVLQLGETPPNPQSKNHLKKIKKLADYERLRKERRTRERERQKQKRQAAVAQGLPRAGPTRKELKHRQTQADTNPNALSVAIDLDYDEVMTDRDIAKCIKQCLRIYTINRRSAQPGRLHFTGIQKNGRIHEVLKKNDGWENWHVEYHFDKTHTSIFDKEKLIYLTCESDNVLKSLEPGCTYVIGGLVDHNHQKGLCHKRAQQAELTTARLPLSEYVDMKTRAVLSTFHVFDIIMRVAEGNNWTKAILETIPQRKGAKEKKTPEGQAKGAKTTEEINRNDDNIATS